MIDSAIGLLGAGKRKKSFLLIFILHSSLFSSFTVGQSPYALKTNKEITLLGIGGAAIVTSAVLRATVDPLTEAEIMGLSRGDVNPLDRQATYHYSRTADRLSDMTLVGNWSLLGAMPLIIRPGRKEVVKISLLYFETILLANGVGRTVKGITQRSRPFVYNPAAPLEEKLERDARQSFFSGHATNAFATAVFTGEVFRHYFPDSKLKPVVWAGALGLATATAVLRYEAGWHYPSDLLVGTAFGSLVGWGIPKLHEVKNNSKLGQRLDIQPWSNGQANGIYLRLAVFSN